MLVKSSQTFVCSSSNNVMFRVAESTKAASPYVNLGCQCSALTFVDQYGTVQVILSCDWSL